MKRVRALRMDGLNNYTSLLDNSEGAVSKIPIS